MWFVVPGDELYDKVYTRFDPYRAMHVNLEHWALGLSVLLRGNLEERIDFCWKVSIMFGFGRGEEFICYGDEVFVSYEILNNFYEKI